MNELQALLGRVSAPSNPMESGSEQEWDDLRRGLNVTIPTELKKLIQLYGSGGFDSFLWLLNPHSRNPHLNLLLRGKEILRLHGERQQQGDRSLPYDLGVEPPALYPWAVTDNGDVLFWRTEGQESVVVYSPRDGEHEEFPLRIDAFLNRLLRGEIRSDLFPDDFPSTAPSFTVLQP